jgi:hypothetical protein
MLDALFSSPAIWFSVPALLGSLGLLAKIGLMFVGSDADTDVDGAGADSGHLFEVFSLLSAFAFLMGFGWGGLGALKGSGLTIMPAVAVGLAGGLAMVGVMMLVMRAVSRLATSGNISAASLKGATGDVQVAVPAAGAGTGEVRLIIKDREKRCTAVSAGPALPSRTRVRVASVNPDNTVTVEAL